MTFFIRRLIHVIGKRMPPPDRWEVYRPMGSVIPGTKFVAFKVPLKEELLKEVEEKDKFSPAILMKLLGDQGLKLGGIIDLTFTFKYYNSEEFLKNAVEYKKIFTPGHDVPSESVFQQFAHAVKKFDAGDNDHIIGVHCTHGVNRTGYLICRYMIEEMNFEPDVAISLFDEARGHKLERENYLKDLKTRKCGQSTYDPNFKLPEEDVRKRGYHGPIKDKSRWRHRRQDHPDWRREHHDSARERGTRPGPGLYVSPFDGQRLPYPQDPGFVDLANGSAYKWPHNEYSQGIRYSGSDGPVYPLSGQYLEGGRSVGGSIPEHFNSDGRDNSFPVDRFIQDSPYSWGNFADGNGYNPYWTGQGHNRGYHSDYHSYKYNPIYNYRGPGPYQGRRNEHRHDRIRENNHDEKGKHKAAEDTVELSEKHKAAEETVELTL